MLAKGLKVVFVIALAVFVAVGASAALDAPSRTAATTTLIEAPREEVWRILMDFEAYPRWNPYMRTVEGRPAAGRSLDIHLEPEGGDARDLQATVFTFKPPRKLRWQSRWLAPGLRDLEYEVIVAPSGRSRAQVTQRARTEGLFVFFADTGSTEAGLTSMAAALKRRAEAGSTDAG
jgi:uncharacterized protein YndB with AHSA1/START domain